MQTCTTFLGGLGGRAVLRHLLLLYVDLGGSFDRPAFVDLGDRVGSSSALVEGFSLDLEQIDLPRRPDAGGGVISLVI